MHDQASALQRDRAAILAGAAALGLDTDALAQTPSFPALWRAIFREYGDPLAPFWVGAAVPFGRYELIDYLCAACSTLGQALRTLARHHRLLSAKLELVLDEGLRTLSLHPADGPDAGPPAAQAVISTYVAGLISTRLRDAVIGEFGVEAAFSGPPSADLRALERSLGGPFRFGAELASLRFSPGALSLPLREARPELGALLESHVHTIAERRGRRSDPLARIRETVRAQLEQGEASLPRVAKALGVGVRTLQRRMASAGLSFRQLLAEERLAAAVGLLERHELGMSEIAFRMGYSEQSGFARAFKRWTGSCPHRYRQRRWEHQRFDAVAD